MNRSRYFSYAAIFVALLLLVVFATSASAEKASGKSWQWRLAPLYLWAVSIDGDQTIGRATVPLKLEFGDIFDNLEAVFTANFEGMYNNRWGFLFDFSYIDIKGTQGPVTVKFKNTLTEVDGLYRVISGEHNVDLLAGLRYTGQETSVEPTPIKVSPDWYDPVIGGRWWWSFADKWSLVVRGDIGGFGVGSDFTWQALGLVDWQPFKNVSFVGGYRGLYQDYSEGSGATLFKYKATLHGPLLGFNIKW